MRAGGFVAVGLVVLGAALAGPGSPPDIAGANLAFLERHAAGAPADALERLARGARAVDLEAVLAGEIAVPALPPGKYVGGMTVACVTFFGYCPPVAVVPLVPFACDSEPSPGLVPLVTPWHAQAQFGYQGWQQFYAVLWTTGELGLTPELVRLPAPATFRGGGCLLFDVTHIKIFEGTGVLVVD